MEKSNFIMSEKICIKFFILLFEFHFFATIATITGKINFIFDTFSGSAILSVFYFAMMESKHVQNQTYWDIAICDTQVDFLHTALHLYACLIMVRTYLVAFEHSHYYFILTFYCCVCYSSSHIWQWHMHNDTILNTYIQAPSSVHFPWWYDSWIYH